MVRILSVFFLALFLTTAAALAVGVRIQPVCPASQTREETRTAAVLFKNGTSIGGEITQETPDKVTIRIGSGEASFPRTEIADIKYPVRRKDTSGLEPVVISGWGGYAAVYDPEKNLLSKLGTQINKAMAWAWRTPERNKDVSILGFLSDRSSQGTKYNQKSGKSAYPTGRSGRSSSSSKKKCGVCPYS